MRALHGGDQVISDFPAALIACELGTRAYSQNASGQNFDGRFSPSKKTLTPPLFFPGAKMLRRFSNATRTDLSASTDLLQ